MRGYGLSLLLAVSGCAFPPGRTGELAVLRAYLDESGTGPRSRLISVAGVVAGPGRWRIFSKEWIGLLRSYGVTCEYKAEWCIKGTHGFSHLLRPDRNRLRKELGQVMDRHIRFGVYASVLADDFQQEIARHMKQDHTFRDAYTWCVRMCLEFIVKAPQRGSAKIACVLDEGHGFLDRFIEYFPTLWTAQKWEKKFFRSLTKASSDQYPPLQAADWLVSECRHDLDQQVFRVRKKYPGFAGSFDKKWIHGGYFNAKRLREYISLLCEYERREVRQIWEQVIADERVTGRMQWP